MSAPPLIDHADQLGIVACLSARENEADKFQVGVGQDVDLGGQSTTETTQCVVIRLDGRRLLIIQHVPCGGGGLGTGRVFAGPSRVLVGTNDRGLDRQEGPDGLLGGPVAATGPGQGIQDRLRGAVPSVT